MDFDQVIFSRDIIFDESLEAEPKIPSN